jgi:hypothetical protein
MTISHPLCSIIPNDRQKIVKKPIGFGKISGEIPRKPG